MMSSVGFIRSPAVAALAPPSVIAIVGLLFEARIAEGPGVTVLCRGTGALRASSFDSALEAGCHSIVSFGVAGGLAPDLRPGDWIIASAIVSGVQTYPTNLPLCRRLLEAVPGAQYAPIVGVDEPIAEPALKAELYRRGIAAVDMESHLAAELAARRGLALASIRVIVDPAHRRIPAAALAGLQLGGTTDALAVLRALVKNPLDLPLVAMLAFDALAARKALVRIRRMLGPGLGLL